MKRLLLLFFIGLILLLSPVSLAERKFINSSGEPLPLIIIKDNSGKPFAILFMTGKEMVIADVRNVLSGAGYYKATEGNFFTVFTSINPLCRGGFGGLQVDRVEWDETGKTTTISGIRPFFETLDGNIKIVSDVSKPKLIDGVLFLKFEGKGTTEYKFKICFGRIFSIEPSI